MSKHDTNHQTTSSAAGVNTIDDSDDDDEIPELADLDQIICNTSEANDSNPLPPVPVTILTGFLGSGKTTLVRHILTSKQHQKRIAVIENEFGGGENDAQLAERLGLTVNDLSTLSVETMIAKDGTDGSSLAEFIELPNGCVCCTVKDSLVETLEDLLSKRADLDYVIIEASGMADPGPISSIFWLDDALESRLHLDGIVACVDAKMILSQLESTSSSVHKSYDESGTLVASNVVNGDEAARQIAFADRIIINKIDLLETQQRPSDEIDDSRITIERVMHKIESINPTAPTVSTTFSNVADLSWILDANCFDANRAKDVEHAFSQSLQWHGGNTEMVGTKCDNPLCNKMHDTNFCELCDDTAATSPTSRRSTTGNLHKHTDAVGTIALFGVGSVDLQKVNSWLASVLWPDQDEKDKVLRARLENDIAHGSSNNSQNDKSYSTRREKQQVYRIKGILSVCHPLDSHGKVTPGSNDWVDDGLSSGAVRLEDGLDQRRYIAQAVNDLWDIVPASDNLHWNQNDTRCCKIVVIGKWLDEVKLKQQFESCFAKE
jgi:G3E family GTPase